MYFENSLGKFFSFASPSLSFQNIDKVFKNYDFVWCSPYSISLP